MTPLSGTMKRELPFQDQAGQPVVVEITAENGGCLRFKTGRGRHREVSFRQVYELAMAGRETKAGDSAQDSRFIPADILTELQVVPDGLTDREAERFIAYVHRMNERRDFESRAKPFTQT